MRLPLIVTIGAIAGATGMGTGIQGISKARAAHTMMRSAKRHHEENKLRLEKQHQITTKVIRDVSKLRLEIQDSFNEFSSLIEQIQAKPEFKTYNKDVVDIPRYAPEELKNVSIGVDLLLGSILGGGVSMALGAIIFGTRTLGFSMLINGIIFNVIGSALSDKARQAWSQMETAKRKIDETHIHLCKLGEAAQQYSQNLSMVYDIYKQQVGRLSHTVEASTSKKWSDFSDEEKLHIENTVLLVQLLYSMCKVKLVLASESETEVNQVNSEEVERSITNANRFISERGLSGI